MKKVASGVTTIYDYDVAGNLISESEADGTPLRDIVYLNGERIAMRLYGSQAGWYFFINDHLGTPQKIVDSSGVVVWQAAYLPFGKAQVLSGSSITNNFRFPGQYYDEETELHYNWNRYYMPAKARYLTADPIGLAGGINLYAYVRGNPIRGADPRGLISAWDLADPVFFAISIRNFRENPGLGTGFELSLDTISLLPIIPSLGWITKADDACRLVKGAKSIPTHANPDRFYIKASELLDDANIVKKHPLNSKQMLGSAEAGHGGVANLSNKGLLKFGGPKGNDPISGSRFFQQADDLTTPGSGIRIEGGHHRLEVIRQRVESGQISPDILIEILKK